ncbi:MAG: hypothetical protein KC978_02950, partial [Candidatus Omnitrophica bacterium]|nr:hypothetical protein [Candidatus Omnitrophota bacterium]
FSVVTGEDARLELTVLADPFEWITIFFWDLDQMEVEAMANPLLTALRMELEALAMSFIVPMRGGSGRKVEETAPQQ